MVSPIMSASSLMIQTDLDASRPSATISIAFAAMT
ncbi:hypothetical protein B14911_26220 [Bacillus sp. NRRL B-14911]|nr:hypothetical protein B14911_26220 [Bacillus sp. NRRL B-14911]